MNDKNPQAKPPIALGPWVIQDFPVDIRLRFKGLCHRQGESMRDVLLNLIMKHLRENGA